MAEEGLAARPHSTLGLLQPLVVSSECRFKRLAHQWSGSDQRAVRLDLFPAATFQRQDGNR